jgi:hypothetical protein
VADVAVDWNSYFQSIKTECPWSLAAWKRGAIDLTLWRGSIFPLGTWEARLYLAPRHNPRQLKKMSMRFNTQRPHEEWLWSHPSFLNNSTPVPVFIQQDRDKLTYIRRKLELFDSA